MAILEESNIMNNKNTMKSLSFGEVLWDIIDGQEHLGGAPLNLSAHLTFLGNESYVASCLGNDLRGQKALEKIKEIGVKTDFIQIGEKYPTGYVTVSLDQKGSPSYEIHENVAWDNISYQEGEIEKIKKTEFAVFCFGTLAQRNSVSRQALENILNAVKAEHIFYDVNLRQNYFSKAVIENSLWQATILKVNDEEVKILSVLLFNKIFSESDFAKAIIKEYGLDVVIITRGGKGCAVYKDGFEFDILGEKIVVADTVGAGDAFSAGFLHQYIRTKSIKVAAEYANLLGAYVASRHGAIPSYSSELREKLGI